MSPYFRAVAIDYDGTLTDGGAPRRDVLAGLWAFRGRGGRALLVTGRIMAELREEFPEVERHFDAVVTENGGQDDAGEVEFHEAYELSTEHIRQVESVLQRRVLRYFRRHGLLDELDAAGMLTWQGSGGFSVDASVRIRAEDRAGIERLVRYCCVPPAAPR